MILYCHGRTCYPGLNTRFGAYFIMRKYETAAVSLLMFTAVLSVWLGLWGPTNTTSWKDWQPLMAAFVALGAAVVAYTAAMAKVRFDERTASQIECRKILGIFLRFDFAVDVLRHEANYLIKLTDPPVSPSENNIVTVDALAINELPEIKQAWNNLDYFPAELSRSFYWVQNALYNFNEFKKDHAAEAYPCEYGMTRSEDLDFLRGILTDLHEASEMAVPQVRKEIAKIRARIGD
jgi:hypothetical protein